MKNMISVADGFQYSVNIGYDLNRDDKLKNFIPTKSALDLLEEILISTNTNSSDRARVLVGAYGKGKSHIILMILSMLMKRDMKLFERLMPKIKENKALKQLIDNYYHSGNRILPVIINGTSTSLPQAFLQALQRTLAENDLMDIMPETNYKAAVSVIGKWKKDFPDVYRKFSKMTSIPVKEFVNELENYNTLIYDEFERLYPSLTAGSIFNPFLGFDVAELYESVNKSLREKGYTGIYVVYDEFSKFLEANITVASVSDTKMLQDFAEKCNRSGKNQLHLLLISHKEISNYIDKLPKQKIDGWRGVSERFKHIHLNNNFTQTYEIIGSVIQKDEEKWNKFCEKHSAEIIALCKRYKEHLVFNDLNGNEMEKIVLECYPLHPISMFILPRLSERVAQNERTLFTFLSAKGKNTLPTYLKSVDESSFGLVTPDVIFDYFEPVLKKEPLQGDLYKSYALTIRILSKLKGKELEQKLVKSIFLIYMLGQFENLKPTIDELVKIYCLDYRTEQIEQAITRLINDDFVVYLKRSNGYLKLKETSGVDIDKEIKESIAKLEVSFSAKGILNESNVDAYIYPSRYNDAREMIRFFKFQFIDEIELEDDVNWNKKSESISADGVIYAVVASSNDSIKQIENKIRMSSKNCKRCVFIIPKKYTDMKAVLKEYNAVYQLKEKASEDELLFEEYEVIYEDLRDIIISFIHSYTHPEKFRAKYYYDGEERNVQRKAALTGLLSDICDDVYSLTPEICNEAVNKNEITTMAHNSRTKVIAGLLRNELEYNLGLTGSGQEVSIMRSILVRTGILINDMNNVHINLNPKDKYVANVISTIVNFISSAKKNGSSSFDKLYNGLILPKHHIGLRKGLIPLLLAAVIHEFKKDIALTSDIGQLNITADTLLQIDASPSEYNLVYLDWNPEKEKFIDSLSKEFSSYIIDSEKKQNSYEYVIYAMKRWYMSLPRYTKEMKVDAYGNKVASQYITFMRMLRQEQSAYDFLFVAIPEKFSTDNCFEIIRAAHEYYDNALADLKRCLIKELKQIISGNSDKKKENMSSLTSVVKDWCEKLQPEVFEQLFDNGTDRCLKLFSESNNDEINLVEKLARVATDLRIEDWDSDTKARFVENIKSYKSTAENFHREVKEKNSAVTSAYEITFEEEHGSLTKKRFDRVATSKRGNLLKNSIESEIESMGQSISVQEKRQILIEILKDLC